MEPDTPFTTLPVRTAIWPEEPLLILPVAITKLILDITELSVERNTDPLLDKILDPLSIAMDDPTLSWLDPPINDTIPPSDWALPPEMLTFPGLPDPFELPAPIVMLPAFADSLSPDRMKTFPK